MRKHSAFLILREAIQVLALNWNDFVLLFRYKSTEIKVPSAELEEELLSSTVEMLFAGFWRASSKLAPTETQWFAPFGIVKVFFPYKPFTGRSGAGF